MMRKQIFILGLLAAVVWSCDDKGPIVIEVPPIPTPRSKIDQYYYAQFQWGKQFSGDTITIEVPDDTLGTDSVPFEWDAARDYYNYLLELRNEPVLDTTNAIELLPEEIDTIHWHYAPATICYPRALIEYWRSNNVDNELFAAANKNVFMISFPWMLKNRVLGFWDIQDYLSNPSIKEGDINWGRVGNNVYKDSLWNCDGYTGVVISFIDDNGVEWRSDNPPTFQDGSYFVMKEVFTNPDREQSYKIIEGEFSARLYNKFGEYKFAKGGKFRLMILTDVELFEQPE